MKRLLCRAIAFLAVAVCGGISFGAFPTHDNICTVDVSKVTGNFDSYNWKWLGQNSQTNSITFTNYGGGFVDLTGYSAGWKVCRNTDSGQVAYIDVTGTITKSNVSWYTDYTNIPPNGTYLSEMWLYDTTTNLVRTIAQGKIQVNNSLYANDDTAFPYPNYSNILTVAVGGDLSGTIGNARVTNYSGSAVAYAEYSKYASNLVIGLNITNQIAGMAAHTVTNGATLGATALQPADTNGWVVSSHSTFVTATVTNNVITNIAINGTVGSKTGQVAYVNETDPIAWHESDEFINPSANLTIQMGSGTALGWNLGGSPKTYTFSQAGGHAFVGDVTFDGTNAPTLAYLAANYRSIFAGTPVTNGANISVLVNDSAYVTASVTNGILSAAKSYTDSATNGTVADPLELGGLAASVYVTNGQTIATASNANYATTSLTTSNVTDSLTNYFRNAANHTNRLGVMTAGFYTNNADESFVLFGPVPYAVTITNCIMSGLGGTYVIDAFTMPRTNCYDGTKTLFLTGATYTVATSITNIPVTYSVAADLWVGMRCTNGASITNGTSVLQYRY